MSSYANNIQKLTYELYDFLSQPGTGKKLNLCTLQHEFTSKCLKVDRDFSTLGIGSFKDFVKQVHGLRVDNADIVHIDKKKVKQCLKNKDAKSTAWFQNKVGSEQNGENSRAVGYGTTENSGESHTAKEQTAESVQQTNRQKQTSAKRDISDTDPEKRPSKDTFKANTEAVQTDSCTFSDAISSTHHPKPTNGTGPKQQVGNHERSQSSNNNSQTYLQSKDRSKLRPRRSKSTLTAETRPRSSFQDTQENENNESDSDRREAVALQAPSCVTPEPPSFMKKNSERKSATTDHLETGPNHATAVREQNAQTICCNNSLSDGFKTKLEEKGYQLLREKVEGQGKICSFDTQDSNTGTSLDLSGIPPNIGKVNIFPNVKDIKYNVQVDGGVNQFGNNNTVNTEGISKENGAGGNKDKKQDNGNILVEKLASIEKQLEKLNKKSEEGEISENNLEKTLKTIGPGEWDEWIKFDQSVCSFDKKVCQYILIADRLPDEHLENYGILGGIHWKFVLDLDPKSDSGGLNETFKHCKKRDAVIVPHTPNSIKQQKGNLSKTLDLNKTQWVFVNGQYESEDNEPRDTVKEWKKSHAGFIKRFMDACITKFDSLKPVICVVLPLQTLGKQIILNVLESLEEYLGSNDFRYRFVSINEELNGSENVQELRTFYIPPLYFESGVRSLLGSPRSKYQLPSRMEGTLVYLEQQEYLSLKENLDILYLGCHEFAANEDEATRERNKKVHRENFLSGNPISFLSLYYREDAQREISGEIVSHIRNVLKEQKRFTSTRIEEISHAPGTGGTTIARRVLWDLHKEYPCAIANISFLNTLSFEEYEEEPSVKALAENIGYLDNKCQVSPIILLDGKSSVVEPLSDQLARKLNIEGKKALLLCCTRSGALGENPFKDKDSFKHCSPFKVNIELEKSGADLEEFKKKYKEYTASTGLGDARRVFHFPLLAMQKEYQPRLREIINSSLDVLQNNKYEYEVMVMVAFLLIYAELPTPALLIYEVFKKHFRKMDRSYSDIKDAFSDTFLNLMISKTGSYWAPRGKVGQTFESFTLQHPLVATYVLEHSKRSLRSIVEEFIDKKVIFRMQELRPLLAELFIYNKGADRSFSLLIEDLKTETTSQIAGEIFSKVATETNDPNFFSNAARFYSYQYPYPDFGKSEDLIQKALAVENISKDRKRGVYDTFGNILKIKLKYCIEKKQIKTLDDLEHYAKQAIEKFHKARDNFHYPKEFTNPLVGEITVWQICFDWIIKHRCKLNSERALQFITNQSPDFFRGSITTCFMLLDFIDEILESASHLRAGSVKTKSLAYRCRMELLQTFGTHQNPNSKRKAAIQSVDVIKTCQELCSTKNFVGASAMELKRLQVHYIIKHATTASIEHLSGREKVYLIKLLKDIVIEEKDYAYCRKLLEIGCLESDASLSLDESLECAIKWVDRSSEMNSYVVYYLYMIYFCKLLEGNVYEYRSKYDKALESCKKRSENNCKRNSPQYFLGKGNEGKMSQLITKTKLEMEYKKLTDDSHQIVQLDDDFWNKYAEKYLRKCEGKIYVQQSGNYPYIALTTGNLTIHIPHWIVGEVNKQFELGDRCSFFVAFRLRGPRAYGFQKIQHKEEANKASP